VNSKLMADDFAANGFDTFIPGTPPGIETHCVLQ